MAKEISNEEKTLFRQAMSGVTPLKASQTLSFTPIVVQPKKRVVNAEMSSNDIFLSNHYTDEVQAETALSYRIFNFPSSRFRELKSGKIPRQASLDLHGLKPEAAQEVLCKFIQKAIVNQKRSLLIIHGKGGQRQAPVLKNLVNHWLPQFPSVAAFHSALPKDGGNGAVYVLLKRTNPS